MAIFYSRQDGAWEDPNTWTLDPTTDAAAANYPGQLGPNDTAVIRHVVTLNNNIILHGDPNVTIPTAGSAEAERVAMVFAAVAGSVNYTQAGLIVADTVTNVETTQVVVRQYNGLTGTVALVPINGFVRIGSPTNPRAHNSFKWNFVRVNSVGGTNALGFVSNHGSTGAVFKFEFYGDASQVYHSRVLSISGTTLTLENPIRVDVGDRVLITPTSDTTQWEVRTVTAVSGSTITLNSALTFPHDTTKTVWLFNTNRAINVGGDSRAGLRIHYAANTSNEEVTLHAVGMPDVDFTYAPWELNKLVSKWDVNNSLVHGGLAMWSGAVNTVGNITNSVFWNGVYKTFGGGVLVEDSFFQQPTVGVRVWGEFRRCWFYGRVVPVDSRIEDSHINHHDLFIFGTGTNDLNVFERCRFGDVYSRPVAPYFYIYTYAPGKVAFIDCEFPPMPSNPRLLFHISPNESITIVLKNVTDGTSTINFWGNYKGVANLYLDSVDKLSGNASLVVEFEQTGKLTLQSLLFATQGVALGVVGAIKADANTNVKVRMVGAGIDEEVSIPSSGSWESFSIGGVPNDTRTVLLLIEAEATALPASVKFDNFKVATGKVDTGEFETYGAIAPVSPFPQVLAQSLVGAADFWNAPKSIVTNPQSMGQFLFDHDKKMTAFKFV